jgi:hypothetical protein
MNLDLRQQRVFDQVELVSGIGTPGLGKMCIMSFVACLTGEGYTDHPSSASPLICAFAIPVNDHMPWEVRQRLKPFAPRIIGTNDGRDGMRAEILRRALAEVILPRLEARRIERAGLGSRRWSRLLGRLWTRMYGAGLERRVRKLLDQAESGGAGPGLEIQIGGAAGRLVALCARDAPDAQEAEWHWAQAIEILDRLCDVAPRERRVPEVRPDRLEWLEKALDARRRATPRRAAPIAVSPFWTALLGPANQADEV